jgi:hypothetical protein
LLPTILSHFASSAWMTRLSPTNAGDHAPPRSGIRRPSRNFCYYVCSGYLPRHFRAPGTKGDAGVSAAVLINCRDDSHVRAPVTWFRVPRAAILERGTSKIPRLQGFSRAAQILLRNFIEYQEAAVLKGLAENGAAPAAMGMPIAKTAGAKRPSHLRWRMEHVRAT